MKLYSTKPSKENYFWELEILPKISILHYKNSCTYLTFTWLFWSCEIIIKKWN
jgi:hypothetical protein